MEGRDKKRRRRRGGRKAGGRKGEDIRGEETMRDRGEKKRDGKKKERDMKALLEEWSRGRGMWKDDYEGEMEGNITRGEEDRKKGSGEKSEKGREKI